MLVALCLQEKMRTITALMKESPPPKRKMTPRVLSTELIFMDYYYFLATIGLLI